MPDQLYRRCPDCRKSGSGSSCPTCGGEGFIPAGVVPNDIAALVSRKSRRWRFRISTLMLLVIVIALASALLVSQLRMAAEAQRASVMERIARIEAEMARKEAAAALAIGPNANTQPKPAAPQPTSSK